MIIDFDNDWKFIEADLPPFRSTDGWGGAKAHAYSKGVPAAEFDDSQWQTVQLPHDFVSAKEYCFKSSGSSEMQDIPEMESIGSRLFAGGCLEGGAAWYRKRFKLGGETENKRVYIHFDGVYRDSTVYINQYYVGEHKSGYSPFYYDITDFVDFDGENIIAVRVDASEREGWWYEGGGIYGHVRLEVVDNVHVKPWGIAVRSVPGSDKKTAETGMEVSVLNRCLEKRELLIETEIRDREGHLQTKGEKTVTAAAWDEAKCSLGLTLDGIHLWDTEDPYLYKAVIRVFSDGRLCDEREVSFGIRELRFDADSGFYINGKHLRIQGVCCHNDHAGAGIGIPDSVNEYRLKKLKSMGANAVRSSHYPASPALLDMCDRLGMLVYEETRRMSSAPDDIEALKAMVMRDRNHPSVFLWGIGNEEIFSQHRSETARTTRTMKAEVRKLDPTRPVTSAVVCWDGERRYDNAEKYVDVTKELDIMGFNYCPTAWDDYHERMPEQPVIITEASSNSGTRGCYDTDERRGHYYVLDRENYEKVENKRKAVKKDMGEYEWKYFAERPYLAGIFIWTGFDYRGEPTPLQYPAVYSQFGIFDYCGFEKDNYYYYKSWWQDEDVLHIFPHWDHSGMTGRPINVHCYSNLEEIELFVNGKSYGRKQMRRNWYLTWENVIYEPGELKAVGYRNGMPAAEEIVKTTGAPCGIRLKAYKSEIRPGDTAVIDAEIVDENGNVVQTARNMLHFSVSGGTLTGTGNGDPGDHDSEKLPQRRAFNGRCQLLVRADGDGTIDVKADSDGLCSGECRIKAV